MFCNYCGEVNEAGSMFCKKCGGMLANTNINPYLYNNVNNNAAVGMNIATGNVKNNKKKIIIIVVAVLLLIACVVCAFLFLKKNNKPKYTDANKLAKDYLNVYLKQDSDAMLEFYYPDYVEVEGEKELKRDFERDFKEYDEFTSDKKVKIEVADVKIEDARKYDVGGTYYEVELDVDIQARATISYLISVEYEEYGYAEKCEYVDKFYAYKIKDGWYMDSYGMSLNIKNDSTPVEVAEKTTELFNDYTENKAKKCVHKAVYKSDVFDEIEELYDGIYTQVSNTKGITWDVNIYKMEDAKSSEVREIKEKYKNDYNLDVDDVRRVIYSIGYEDRNILAVYYTVKVDDVWYMALDVPSKEYE